MIVSSNLPQWSPATGIPNQKKKIRGKLGNFIPAISLEGDEAAADSRRGAGTYQKVLRAMCLLRERKLPYGISSCYTSQNWDSITSEEYYDSLIEMGAYSIWYFHYMPVGNDAAPELLPTSEQRREVYHRVRRLRKDSSDVGNGRL